MQPLCKWSGTKTIFLLVIFFVQIPAICYSVPLSTNSRWIVDQGTGKRVKLACVNWASHLQPMIAEGLEKKPLNYIAAQIAANGFNCVRFTWATFMFTRPDYFNLTVSQSLDNYNLSAAKSGIAKNNPWIMNTKILELHMAVVNELGKNNLMVVLDNHLSKPGWCCNEDDGNGFFGDSSFDPSEWLNGLKEVARTYKDNSAVVGMSMRNELRGERQNEPDWYKYMQQGATTIHNENPDFLVIISGLSFDTNLGFLKSKPLDININNKLVFEAHWYAFGTPAEKWKAQTNNLCAAITRAARDSFLFVTTGVDIAYPLILSEFGIDQSGQNEGDNRYISCLLAEVAEKDIDWALWSFQGSYMLREGIVDKEEYYGVMDFNWDRPRNSGFVERLQLIRQMNQGSSSENPTYYIMFHPQSGQCVQIDNNSNVFLASCKDAGRWDQHQDNGLIKLAGSPGCLQVAGDIGGGPTVSNDCSSKWKYVSSSGHHLAAQNGEGSYFCLEKNASDGRLVTNKCLCVGDDLSDVPTCDDNPEAQWFKLVPANV